MDYATELVQSTVAAPVFTDEELALAEAREQFICDEMRAAVLAVNMLKLSGDYKLQTLK